MDVGLLLGSGLSGVAEQTVIEHEFAYEQIDGYPTTKIPGHPGRLVIGKLGDKRCAVFMGRFHGYEGAPAQQLTLPVQVAWKLGARTMMLTNAVGGINATYRPGDILLISDHINLMGTNSLYEMICAYDGNPFLPDQATPFVSLNELYRTDIYPALLDRLSARRITLHQGVLAVLRGPNYETAAEVRMLRALGADAACMSTVPEALYAKYVGMSVAALALVTNLANDGSLAESPRHEDVLLAAKQGAANFAFTVGEAVTLL